MSSETKTALSSTLSNAQLQLLCDTAIKAAQDAGQVITSFNHDDIQRICKDTGSSEASQIVTAVDIASEEIIKQCLQEISEPLSIGFLGEESLLDHDNLNERFEKPYFWCVDPLDGTLAFAEGRPGYAVSIALVEHSGKSLIGVVYDPERNTLYHAMDGQGSYRNFTPFHQSDLRQVNHTSASLNVYADASFKAHANHELALAALETCAKTLGMDGVRFIYGNGAVKNACHVLGSSNSYYLKLPKKEDGGGSIWDYAATACIAREAGSWASNIHGQTLALNRQGSTFMNHEGVIFASNSEMARYLIDAL